MKCYSFNAKCAVIALLSASTTPLPFAGSDSYEGDSQVEMTTLSLNLLSKANKNLMTPPEKSCATKTKVGNNVQIIQELINAAILLKSGTVTRNLTFREISVPITAVVTADGSVEVSIVEPEISMPCLQFTFSKKSKAAELNFVSGYNCLSEYGLKGSDLMGLVDPVAIASGTHNVEVEDAASVSCDSERVYLRYAHFYEKGDTWYGSKGFRPREMTSLEYQDFLKNFRSSSVKSYLKCVVASLRDSGFELAVRKLEEEYIKANSDDPELSLGRVMHWLYGHSCKSYKRLNDVLVSGALECKREPLGTAFKKFDKLTERLVKTYDQ